MGNFWRCWIYIPLTGEQTLGISTVAKPTFTLIFRTLSFEKFYWARFLVWVQGLISPSLGHSCGPACLTENLVWIDQEWIWDILGFKPSQLPLYPISNILSRRMGKRECGQFRVYSSPPGLIFLLSNVISQYSQKPVKPRYIIWALLWNNFAEFSVEN